MGVRTVRLDDEAERTLAAVRQRTGLTISEVLKRGLHAYAAASLDDAAETPYEVYRRLNLGPGGYAVAAARDAKAAVVAVVAAKHRR
ncbi:MAG: hypothetical protein OXU21_01950 [Chloroflexota bacterium]|nr:hypothetical protein [Chloroflexota bacterium]